MSQELSQWEKFALRVLIELIKEHRTGIPQNFFRDEMVSKDMSVWLSLDDIVDKLIKKGYVYMPFENTLLALRDSLYREIHLELLFKKEDPREALWQWQSDGFLKLKRKHDRMTDISESDCLSNDEVDNFMGELDAAWFKCEHDEEKEELRKLIAVWDAYQKDME